MLAGHILDRHFFFIFFYIFLAATEARQWGVPHPTDFTFSGYFLGGYVTPLIAVTRWGDKESLGPPLSSLEL